MLLTIENAQSTPITKNYMVQNVRSVWGWETWIYKEPGGTSGPEYRRLRERGHPYIFDRKERNSDLCGQRKLHINRFQFTIRKTALIMIKWVLGPQRFPSIKWSTPGPSRRESKPGTGTWKKWPFFFHPNLTPDKVPRRIAMRFEVPSGTFHRWSHLTLTEAQRSKSPVGALWAQEKRELGFKTCVCLSVYH